MDLMQGKSITDYAALRLLKALTFTRAEHLLQEHSFPLDSIRVLLCASVREERGHGDASEEEEAEREANVEYKGVGHHETDELVESVCGRAGRNQKRTCCCYTAVVSDLVISCYG